MEKDKHITKVIFRQFPAGEVIAIFPELPGTNDDSTCESYMHVGQHSSCHFEALYNTKPAKCEDIAPLKAELEGLGYNLKVVKKSTYKMQLERRAIIKEQCRG